MNIKTGRWWSIKAQPCLAWALPNGDSVYFDSFALPGFHVRQQTAVYKFLWCDKFTSHT